MSTARVTPGPPVASRRAAPRTTPPPRVAPPRVLLPHSPLARQVTQSVAARPAGSTDPTTHHSSAELGTGRAQRYEWELFVADILDRLSNVENATGTAVLVIERAVPAATWSITHNLDTAPGVLVVAPDGTQLIAEVAYPDLNTVVITHGQPYAGTAYLRG